MHDDKMTFVVGLLNISPCVQKLTSEGISDNALRYTFLNDDKSQLLASGWVSRFIINSDGDGSVH